MCLQQLTCRLNHHMIQLNINMHGTWQKKFVFSILSSGDSPDAQSRAFSIAMNHRQIASVMEVTGTILPERYANVITQHEQKKKILSHATSIENKGKQTKDRKTFFISNIVSIVTYPSKKTDHNEVN